MSFHISLVGRKNLSTEIYRRTRDAILNSLLSPGDPLPASRELARTLSVSRMTLTLAYDHLTAEGFATTRIGAGTFVSQHIMRSRDRKMTEPVPPPPSINFALCWSDVFGEIINAQPKEESDACRKEAPVPLVFNAFVAVRSCAC